MIQRYELEHEDFAYVEWFNNPKGRWVKYDDHIKELEAVKNRVCEWKVIENSWIEPTCENDMLFPKDVSFNYCPYCGGKIEIKE